MNIMSPAPQACAPPQEVTLFFGLKPPAEVARRIVRAGSIVGGAHRLEGHWMRPDLVHLTLALCHQGRAGLDDAITRATEMGDGLRHRPVFIHFDRTCSFAHGAGPHPFVLCGAQELEEVIALRTLLRARMRRAGFDVPSGFTPHATLLWADRIVDAHPLLPIFWMADELLLIVSHLGKSRHTHVARWPLR